ncbi:putative serine esterase [Paratrimastix pyriformis]|uniref:Serine esterase n=1 Tax=Paratrimastix pyriformis TaxID=342808 RepID=A0ABQ8U343_9EUKA|nr:putative serine esterase [Paratrimastix pyriformis]
MELPLVTDLAFPYRLRPAKTSPPAGLIIVTHGITGNELQLAALAPNIPDSMAVALVRSPIELWPGSYSAFEIQLKQDGHLVFNTQQMEAARHQMARFVGELQTRLQVPPARTILCGFSQGGMLSAMHALTAPGTLRAFAMISSMIPPEVESHISPARESLSNLQALITHGRNDPVLPPWNVDNTLALLGRLNIPREEHMCACGHEVTPEAAGHFCRWVGKVLATGA